ncbi:MAG TPA: VTT domain-containing protein [Anaerolineales bacterium]
MSHFLGLFQSFFISLKNGQLPQLGIWTYFLLVFLVAVEGPFATLLGAAAASAGLMRLGWVFIAASTGNLTADSLWYTLGYIGKIEIILRIGQKLGISRELLERLQRGLREHTTRILFIAKLTVSFVIPSLIAAGLVKAPWRRWFPAIFAGELIWTGSLILLGFYTTEAIKRVEKGVEYLALSGGILFVIFLIFMGRRLLQKKYQEISVLDEKIEN